MLLFIVLLKLLRKLAFCCKGHENFVVTVNSSPQYLSERAAPEKHLLPVLSPPRRCGFTFRGCLGVCCWQPFSGSGEEQEEPFLGVRWCEPDGAFLVSADCVRGRTSSVSGEGRARADAASRSAGGSLCSRAQIARGCVFQNLLYLPQMVSHCSKLFCSGAVQSWSDPRCIFCPEEHPHQAAFAEVMPPLLPAREADGGEAQARLWQL